MIKRNGSWNTIRRRIIIRDNYTCMQCNYKHNPKLNIGLNSFCTDLVVDHILPISLNGEQLNHNNLQTLCIDCNRKKNKLDQSNIAKIKRENGK